MPIYRYKCRKCGEEFEERKGIEGRHMVRCPMCHYIADLVIQGVNLIKEWPSERRERFRKVFEGRRIERPREFG